MVLLEDKIGERSLNDRHNRHAHTVRYEGWVREPMVAHFSPGCHGS